MCQSLSSYPQENFKLLYNPHFNDGLITSLILGIETLFSQGSDAILVLLADQIAIGKDKLLELIHHYQHGDDLAIAAALHGDARNPVILSRQLWPEIQKLTGDSGAKKLLCQYRGRVKLIEWGEGLHFLDVDEAEDYQKLCLAMGWNSVG
ncbi:MAG: NTP transferase domain-containing protein [Deinococcales bacterium]